MQGCYVLCKDDDEGRLAPVEKEDDAERITGRKDALVFKFVGYMLYEYLSLVAGALHDHCCNQHISIFW